MDLNLNNVTFIIVTYNSEQVINNLPKIEDWLSNDFIEKNNLLNWNQAMKELHASEDNKNINSKSYRRLVFDEICANFITLSGISRSFWHISNFSIV